MTIYCLTVGLLFFAIALYNMRRAFFIFIWSLPFNPAYIAIPIGHSGAGLSLRRMFVYELLLLLCLSYLARPEAWADTIKIMRRWRVFFFALMALYAAKLLSTIQGGELIRLAYWMDEVAEITVILFLTIKYINNIQTFRSILLIVTASLFLCEAIVLVEYLLGHNLLEKIVTVEVHTAGKDVLSGFQRDNRYRTMGLFDNPLSLAEFLCYGAVFAYSAYKILKTKWIPALAIVLVVPVIYTTGSRSGLLVISILFLAALYFHYIGHIDAKLRRFIWLITISCILPLSIYFGYYLVNTPAAAMEYLSVFGRSLSSDISVLYRAEQYTVITQTIFNNVVSGLLGVGIKSNIIKDLNIPLDSYYLRVLIEGGTIGLTAFIGHLAYVLNGIFKSYNSEAVRSDLGMVFVWNMSFLVTFISYKFLVSMSHSNVYFYLASGILFCLIMRPGSFRSSSL